MGRGAASSSARVAAIGFLVVPTWITSDAPDENLSEPKPGQPLAVLPEKSRRRYTGPWGDKVDARMHLDAWRRILDKEGADYAT